DVTYTITASNGGPEDLTKTVTLTDDIPAETDFVSVASNDGWDSPCHHTGGAHGTVTCTTPTISASTTTGQVVVVAHIVTPTAPGTVVTNTSCAHSASEVDPNPNNNCHQASFVVGGGGGGTTTGGTTTGGTGG